MSTFANLVATLQKVAGITRVTRKAATQSYTKACRGSTVAERSIRGAKYAGNKIFF